MQFNIMFTLTFESNIYIDDMSLCVRYVNHTQYNYYKYENFVK